MHQLAQTDTERFTAEAAVTTGEERDEEAGWVVRLRRHPESRTPTLRCASLRQARRASL